MTTRIVRVTQRANFAILPNEALEHPDLSFRARGILAYLLSRPGGWETSAERLSEQGREGRDAVRTALGELEAVGYLRRAKAQDSRGRWVTTVAVYDTPQTRRSEANAQVAPTTGNQPSGNQPSVSQAPLTRTENKRTTSVGGGVGTEGGHARWTPTASAMRTARESVTITDIQVHIQHYRVRCAERHKDPDSGEWLRWLLADEQRVRQERAAQTTPRRWWHTAAD